MSLAATIDVSGEAQVRQMLAKLQGQLTDRTILHKSIAGYAETLTRQHLTVLAGTRHKTASRLGAQPSGHLARAAESVISEGTDQAAVVSVVSPGLRRAFGPMTIVPRNGAKYLTIPAAAESYNRRAGSFNDLRVQVFKGGSLLALVRDGKDGARAQVLYWLKKSVSQPQDRTLLPADDEFAQAAYAGVRAYLRMLQAAAAQPTSMP